jgi:hypothetical protein
MLIFRQVFTGHIPNRRLHNGDGDASCNNGPEKDKIKGSHGNAVVGDISDKFTHTDFTLKIDI